MGAACSRGINAHKPLATETIRRLEELFSKMDLDGNKEITLDEAIKFWGTNFAKVNANAMFNEVDTDGTKTITKTKFLAFWEQVKKSGYSDEDILSELDSMLEHGSWVDWKDSRDVENKDHHGKHVG
jgi:Ca2+-binding EF-hand superfamily protein